MFSWTSHFGRLVAVLPLSLSLLLAGSLGSGPFHGVMPRIGVSGTDIAVIGCCKPKWLCWHLSRVVRCDMWYLTYSTTTVESKKITLLRKYSVR